MSPSNLRAEPIFIDNHGNEVKNLDSETNESHPEYIQSRKFFTAKCSSNSHNNYQDFHGQSAQKRLSSDYNTSRAQDSQSKMTTFSSNQLPDDHSTGKYSDSGYDTLRPEGYIRKEDRIEEPASALVDSSKIRKSPKGAKRPETWSPEKFSSQWNQYEDSRSKDDESKVVKEFSYEYIKEDEVCGINSTVNVNEKSGQTVGMSLESPKIVRETQEATQRNLVQDRIRAFSGLKTTNSNCHTSRRKSLDTKVLAYSSVEDELLHSDQTRIIPLQMDAPQMRVSDDLVAPIQAEFAVSKSSIVKAQEAQVKSVHEYTKNPQDIINSRLSKINLRKFLFEEDKFCSDVTESSNHQYESNTKRSNGVRNIMKNFENKYDSEFQQYQESEFNNSRRRFHSDSDILLDNHPNNEEINRAQTDEPFLAITSHNKSENILNESSDSIIPPRPPKKPLLGGDMSRRTSSTKPKLVESIDEFMNHSCDRFNYSDNNPWSEREDSQLYANNPLVYPESIQVGVNDIGMPPEEVAPPPPVAHIIFSEENYLPMSPPKKPLHGTMAPASSSSSLSSKHQATPEPSGINSIGMEFEEHTYIEMNGDSAKKAQRPILAPPVRSNANNQRIDLSKFAIEQSAESPRYYEIDEKDESQHYEYIYRAGSHYESIYMEVPGAPLLCTSIDDRPVVPKKPSDLKHKIPSSKSHLCIQTSSVDSFKINPSGAHCDLSSDADDEASKDFESLDFPKNKRFSLSDTFRPASYYLSGAEPSSDPDAHDSSDSDLVSPPPIPTSPPPLDELDTEVKATTFDFDNLSTPEPPPHLRNALNTSRSLRSNCKKSRENSISSQNLIKDKHSFSNSSIHSDKFKRRPVFEDSLDCLQNEDSFVLGSEDHYPISPVYPELGIITPIQRDRSNSRSSHDIMLSREKHNPPSYRSKSSLDHNGSFHLETSYSSSRNDIQYNGAQHTRQSSLNASLTSSASFGLHLLNARSSSSLRIPEEDQKHSFPDSKNKSQDIYSNFSEEATYQNYPLVHYSSSHTTAIVDSKYEGNVNPNISNHQRTASDISNRSLKSPSCSSNTGNFGPQHERGNSNVSIVSETSPRAAPYYYSDVIRDKPEQTEHLLTSPRSRAYQLNNQRDLEANKRQDIGRKVNPISPSPFDQRQLASELQASAHMFHKSVGSPDERNVYEADTLQKIKKRALTPNFEIDSRNVYPYGLTLKSDSLVSVNTAGHRRTRSLEGLMDDHERVVASSSHSEVPSTSNFHTTSTMNNKGRSASVTSHLTSNYLSTREDRRLSTPTVFQSGNAYVSHDVNKSNIVQSFQPNNSTLPSSINGHHEHNETETVCEENWDSDSEWRDQLRRASLRHTRSLETLDEPKQTGEPLNPTYGRATPLQVTGDEKLSSQTCNPFNALNEYRVDYREGLINPVGKPLGITETLERTRRGLTCLEGYEWDSNEEKFRKPHVTDMNLSNDQDNANQSFLAEGLPAPQIDHFADNEETRVVDPTYTPTSNSINSSMHPVSDRNSPSQMKMDGFSCRTSTQRGEGRHISDHHLLNESPDEATFSNSPPNTQASTSKPDEDQEVSCTSSARLSASSQHRSEVCTGKFDSSL